MTSATSATSATGAPRSTATTSSATSASAAASESAATSAPDAASSATSSGAPTPRPAAPVPAVRFRLPPSLPSSTSSPPLSASASAQSPPSPASSPAAAVLPDPLTSLLESPPSADALQRQIASLRRSKHDLVVASDARARTYELRIARMQAELEKLGGRLADANVVVDEQAAHIGDLHAAAAAAGRIQPASLGIDARAELAAAAASAAAQVAAAEAAASRAADPAAAASHAVLACENAFLREQLALMLRVADPLAPQPPPALPRLDPHFDDADTLSSLPPVSATSVLHEVERILRASNQPGPIRLTHDVPERSPESTTATLLIDRACQTDPSIILPEGLQDPHVTICELAGERDFLKKSLDNANARNDSLAATLDQLRAETTALESQFGRLLGETETAMAAERLSRATIEEQRETIVRYSEQAIDLAKQIEAYRAQIDRLHDEHAQFRHAQAVLHYMSQVHIHHLRSNAGGVPANPDGIDGATSSAVAAAAADGPVSHPAHRTARDPAADPAADPVAVLELQWLADRERLTADITMLQRTIQGLERENQSIRDEMGARMASMHSESEWALMIAKVTIAKDESRRAATELRERMSVIETLQSHVSALEAAAEVHKKDAKVLKDRIAKLKDEKTQRDAQLKAALARVAECERTIKAADARARSAGTLQAHKDAIIKDLRSRLGGSARSKSPAARGAGTGGGAAAESPEAASAAAAGSSVPASKAAVDGVQAAVKACQQELARKAALAKHWKAKAETLDKELAALKSATEHLIDPKMCETLQAHLRVTRQRAKETEAFVAAYAAREQQFIGALKQALAAAAASAAASAALPTPDTSSLRDTPAGLDRSEVLVTANEISRRLLGVDLDDVVPLAASAAGGDFTAQLTRVLEQDDFETDLARLLIEAMMLTK
ncbi:hypothetical protein HK105_207861 [Polyrhizophydium stewartii]|uniref:Uncharacterized protein n=1 Tax=Polyrhizophydium stewartii TaxID=2732419 RepID=A0ABR4MZE2_9FUNG